MHGILNLVECGDSLDNRTSEFTCSASGGTQYTLSLVLLFSPLLPSLPSPLFSSSLSLSVSLSLSLYLSVSPSLPSFSAYYTKQFVSCQH